MTQEEYNQWFIKNVIKDFEKDVQNYTKKRAEQMLEEILDWISRNDGC
jgi:ribosomal protein S20